jgi:hypothetical protein
MEFLALGEKHSQGFQVYAGEGMVHRYQRTATRMDQKNFDPWFADEVLGGLAEHRICLLKNLIALIIVISRVKV